MHIIIYTYIYVHGNIDLVFIYFLLHTAAAAVVAINPNRKSKI